MGLKLKQSGGNFGFFCPGCNQWHTVGPSWGFNGDLEKPTFSPSVLVRSGHYCDFGNEHGCWCTHNSDKKARGEEPSMFECFRCHSFITDGKIQFLGDCTHGLVGQTVELPDVENLEGY